VESSEIVWRRGFDDGADDLAALPWGAPLDGEGLFANAAAFRVRDMADQRSALHAGQRADALPHLLVEIPARRRLFVLRVRQRQVQRQQGFRVITLVDVQQALEVANQ